MAAGKGEDMAEEKNSRNKEEMRKGVRGRMFHFAFQALSIHKSGAKTSGVRTRWWGWT